jgi:Tfp pilus assembly protein PilF
VPLALLVLVCAASGWLAIRRGWRGPAAALAYFCLNLLPVAGLFPMAFYSLSFVSDHLVYVSLLGVCALCAEGLAGAGERPGLRAVSHVAAILILGACAVLTWQRAGDFGSAERLWRNTVALNPGSPEAQNNYGLALKRDGRPRAAEACFRAALHLQPAMPAALTNLAAVLVQERRWPEAAQAYRRLLAIDAGPKSYNNYGVALLYQGDPATAAAQFKEALLLDPTLSSARYNLSKIAPAPGNGAPAGRN